MTKTFVSNLVLIVLLNLVVKPFFILGIDAEVQNQVGSEAYGLYFALLNFSFLFNILLDFGIVNYNTKTIAEYPHLAKNRLGSLLGLRSALFVIYALFTFALGAAIGYKRSDFGLLGVLMLNQFFVALILFFRSNFSGLHHFKTDAFFSVFDRMLLIVICSYLLWWRPQAEPFKIEWFIYAQTASYGLSAFLGWIMAQRFLGSAKIRIKRLFSIVILRQSFPYALLILLMMIYNRMDSVMLERLHPNGAKEAGIYAQGFRLLDAVSMFALLFAGLLLPIFSRILAQKDELRRLVQLAGGLLLVTSMVIAVVAFFLAHDIISWRYYEHVEASSTSFQWLILSFVPVSLTYIFGTLLTAHGKLKQLNIMAISGLVLNFSLNYILIPLSGATGAALATLVTQIFTALVQLWLAHRILTVAFSKMFAFRMGLFALLLASSAFVLSNYETVPIVWLIFAIAHLVIASLLGVFPIKKSLDLLRLKDEN